MGRLLRLLEEVWTQRNPVAGLLLIVYLCPGGALAADTDEVKALHPLLKQHFYERIMASRSNVDSSGRAVFVGNPAFLEKDAQRLARDYVKRVCQQLENLESSYSEAVGFHVQLGDPSLTAHGRQQVKTALKGSLKATAKAAKQLRKNLRMVFSGLFPKADARDLDSGLSAGLLGIELLGAEIQSAKGTVQGYLTASVQTINVGELRDGHLLAHLSNVQTLATGLYRSPDLN
jgi:hypothetical protein